MIPMNIIFNILQISLYSICCYYSPTAPGALWPAAVRAAGSSSPWRCFTSSGSPSPHPPPSKQPEELLVSGDQDEAPCPRIVGMMKGSFLQRVNFNGQMMSITVHSRQENEVRNEVNNPPNSCDGPPPSVSHRIPRLTHIHANTHKPHIHTRPPPLTLTDTLFSASINPYLSTVQCTVFNRTLQQTHTHTRCL